MAESPPTTRKAFLASKVLPLLEELSSSPAGAVAYRHIREILDAHEHEAEETRRAYLDLLRTLLDIHIRHLPADSEALIEARMLRRRLAQEPLTRAEIDSLRRHIAALAGAEGLPGAAPPPPAETGPGEEPLLPAGEPAPGREQTAETPESSPGERHVDLTHRRHLNEKRERIRKIQEILVRQVSEVIKQNEKFGVLLEVEYETLQQTDNIRELETLKQALINEVAKLRDGHEALARKLESAAKYLQIIETEGQHLNEELTRVHILSLTDELTELPNRRAFMRRLEDEVARVQRYGYPLSLALIDMDGFKAINDKYGHAAGDEVLRNFASNVLSIFRHHDMVARYGGEEFAVLLPNTDKGGALRALEKVRKRTAECPYQFEGRTMAMPTFSAGIALYKPGETPGNLIERADKALYQAKRLGRNRIELAQHDSAELSIR